MRSPQFYAGVVRAMLFFSILCHLVGFSAPGWLCLKKIKKIGAFAYKETEKSEAYGVWYALRCGEDDTGAHNCIPENYYTTESIYGSDRLTYNPGKSTFLHWQLQTTAALVACIFGTVFVHMQRNLLLQYRPGQPPPSKTKYILALVCCTVSGSLLSWPVSRYRRVNRNYQRIWALGITISIPYALIAAGVGAFLNWVSFYFCRIFTFMARSLLSWPVSHYIRVNQNYQRIWALGITISIPYALIAAGVGAFLNWVSVLMLLVIFCKGMCLSDSQQQIVMQPATQRSLLSWPVSHYIRVNQNYQRIWALGITISIPYALIAAGVGAFLNWVSVLMLLVIFCKGMCLPDSQQQIVMQPATQTQMIPLMPVQNPQSHTGYADPMNPMYQPTQPYSAAPGGYRADPSQTHHQYSYQPPMYPAVDGARTDGQYYPHSQQQYSQYQYNPQNTDSAYWQKSMPT